MTRMNRTDALRAAGVPEPALQFWVRPEYGRLFTVLVFSTIPRMLRYLEFARPEKRIPRDAMAFTCEQRREIILAKSTATDNTVAHEMHHAAMLWAEITGLDPVQMARWNDPVHERVAEVHGNLVEQFWKQYLAAGFERPKYRRRKRK